MASAIGASVEKPELARLGECFLNRCGQLRQMRYAAGKALARMQDAVVPGPPAPKIKQGMTGIRPQRDANGLAVASFPPLAMVTGSESAARRTLSLF